MQMRFISTKSRTNYVANTRTTTNEFVKNKNNVKMMLLSTRTRAKQVTKQMNNDN